MRVVVLLLSLTFAGCMGEVGEMPSTTDDAGTTDAGTDQDAGVISDDDAGTTVDAGTIDAGPNLIPVFVLTGKQGRRAISCDDGLTWKHDISFDDSWPEEERYRCWQGDYTLSDGGTQHTDCDHNAYSSTSLQFANGAFLQTMGWGAPGTFHRSTDGVNWVSSNGVTATELLVGPNKVVSATRYPMQSPDNGVTWASGIEIPISNANNEPIWNIRGGISSGGTFVVLAQDGASYDILYSDDEGATWNRSTLDDGSRADICGAGHPAVSSDGTIVTLNVLQPTNEPTRVIACRSTDRGHTFSVHEVATNVWPESRLLWAGAEFIVWSNGKVHRSPDGTTWTTQDTQLRVNGALQGGPNPGAVAFANGTFVAVKGGWAVWYEQQRFYRSTDGVTWDELAEGTYRQGHPVTQMAAGIVERSAVCDE